MRPSDENADHPPCCARDRRVIHADLDLDPELEAEVEEAELVMLANYLTPRLTVHPIEDVPMLLDLITAADPMGREIRLIDAPVREVVDDSTIWRGPLPDRRLFVSLRQEELDPKAGEAVTGET